MSASSGPQDSAQTLYYNNTHYNDTTQPIQSYHKSDLRANFINNASNYQVSINKLKISSLDGIKYGDIPQDQWEFGLQAGNNNIQIGYVSNQGIVQGTGRYEEYYAIPQTDTSNVILYQSNGILPPNQILTFAPVDDTSQIVYPLNAFFDYNKNKIFVVAVGGVYLYNNLGVYISKLLFANIVNSNYNVESGTLIICNSDYANQEWSVVLITESEGALSSRIITANHAAAPLTDLMSADTDGTIIIVAYNYTEVTTYNFHDLSSITDQSISNTYQITNILVDSETNRFTFTDSYYIPYLCVSSNVGSSTNPSFIDVDTGASKLNTTSLYNNTTSLIASYDQFVFIQNLTAALAGPQTLVASTPYQNLSTLTVFSILGNTGPHFINFCLANDNNNSILSGLIYTSNSDLQIQTLGADATWTTEYTINSSGLYSNSATDILTIPQLVQNTISKEMYVVFGNQPTATNNFKILKSSSNVSIQNTPRPCLSYTGTWEIINSNQNIQSMVIDPNFANQFWGLNNNIIYKGYLVNGNYINWQQWYKNTNASLGVWSYYITMPFESANYNLTQFIFQNNLTTFKNGNSHESISANYTYIQQAIRKNLLYVVDNSIIKQYNYETLAFIKNLQLTAPNGLLGQTTSYYILPQLSPTTAVYSLNDFIVSFNLTLQGLYNLLNKSGIAIKSAPYFEVDYESKFATLNYDVNYSLAGYGIYVNALLYKYLKFPATLITDSTSPFNGFYKYTLNETGLLTQSQYSVYQLNGIDKLLILTNLPILGDFQGTSSQTRIFTDLDLDTQANFFTGSGEVIYQPELLRKYDLVSNTQITRIDYEFKIAYKNGEIVPYYIPAYENVSIKLEFDRVY